MKRRAMQTITATLFLAAALLFTVPGIATAGGSAFFGSRFGHRPGFFARGPGYDLHRPFLHRHRGVFRPQHDLHLRHHPFVFRHRHDHFRPGFRSHGLFPRHQFGHRGLQHGRWGFFTWR